MVGMKIHAKYQLSYVLPKISATTLNICGGSFFLILISSGNDRETNTFRQFPSDPRQYLYLCLSISFLIIYHKVLYSLSEINLSYQDRYIARGLALNLNLEYQNVNTNNFYSLTWHLPTQLFSSVSESSKCIRLSEVRAR